MFKTVETPEEWDAIVPVGSEVLYFPSAGHRKFIRTRTKSKAKMVCGTLCVALNEKTVSAACSHVLPIGLPKEYTPTEEKINPQESYSILAKALLAQTNMNKELASACTQIGSISNYIIDNSLMVTLHEMAAMGFQIRPVGECIQFYFYADERFNISLPTHGTDRQFCNELRDHIERCKGIQDSER